MLLPLTMALSINLSRNAATAFGISRTITARPTHASSHLICRSMASESSASALEVTADGVYIVDQMPEPLPALKNTYYLLRHGQSEGNVEGVISSARSLATSSKHGLTPLGYEQGLNSASDLFHLIESQSQMKEGVVLSPSNKVYFYSSPFSRAKQTAEACLDGIALEENQAKAQELNLHIQKDIIIEDGLMERFFGELDAQPLSTYGYVWPNDMKDPTQTSYNVESVAAVSTRLREVIMKIEESEVHKNGNGDSVVLTSHADVLQIMQVFASGLENVGDFSSYRFGNGEVRFMGRTTDTLPAPQPLELPKDDA